MDGLAYLLINNACKRLGFFLLLHVLYLNYEYLQLLLY